MPAGTRSEALDEETLGLMFLSGQRHISYAPESGSVLTLQKIKKKIKIDRMKQSIRSARKKRHEYKTEYDCRIFHMKLIGRYFRRLVL